MKILAEKFPPLEYIVTTPSRSHFGPDGFRRRRPLATDEMVRGRPLGPMVKLTDDTVGQMIFTPPMVDHAMKFTKDSVWLTLSRNPRDQASYEGDVIRIKLL